MPVIVSECGITMCSQSITAIAPSRYRNTNADTACSVGPAHHTQPTASAPPTASTTG